MPPQGEFEEARLIQRGLLPAEPPQIRGMQVATALQPADGVGMDLFDTLPLGQGVGISVFDLAWTGLPAARLMSNLQTAVRALAQENAAPASVCANVNHLLGRDMPTGQSATFCFARVDPGRVVYSNAGHNPPLLIRSGGLLERLAEGGPPPGVSPKATFDQGEVRLAPGDRLVFYTGGITEARSRSGETYGEGYLAGAAIASRLQPVDVMKDLVLADVNGFAAGHFNDDATIVVVGIE
jgi:phosphoserine phosphatase RsbU/P